MPAYSGRLHHFLVALLSVNAFGSKQADVKPYDDINVDAAVPLELLQYNLEVFG